MITPLLQRVQCLYGEGISTSKNNTNPVINRQINPQMGCTPANMRCECQVGVEGARESGVLRSLCYRKLSSYSGKPLEVALLLVTQRKPKGSTFTSCIIVCSLPVASTNRNGQHKGEVSQFCSLSWAKLVIWAIREWESKLSAEGGLKTLSSSGSPGRIPRKDMSNVSKLEGKQSKGRGVVTLWPLQRGLVGYLFILQSAKGKRTSGEFVAHRSRI